jgi:hypothetical protein
MRLLESFKTAVLSASLALVLILTGCSGSGTQSDLQQEATASATRSATFTATEVHVATHTPTPLKIPTVTLTPSPIVATRTPTDALILINDLLTTPPCDLPCWWGVRVGQPYEQAEDTFYQMGLPLEANGFQGFLASTPGKELVRDYDLYIQISQTNRMVAAINVWSTNVSEQPHPFTDLWNHYSWSALLGRFGKPSKYRARIMSTPKRIVREGEPYGIFELALNYEHIGLTTRYAYSISLGKKGNPTRVCPRFDQVYDIGLYLYDPNDHEAIDFSDEAYTYKSFNGLTVDEFYAKFAHSDQPPCLPSSP